MRCPISVQRTHVWEHLCNYCATRSLQRFQMCRRFVTTWRLEPHPSILERPQKQPTFCQNYMPLTSLDRLRTLASQLTVILACDLRTHGIRRELLKRALDRRVLVRISRGLYFSAVRRLGWRLQLALACQRVPRGVVCLVSALQFHGIFPSIPGPIWIAIDRKARKPLVNGSRMRFVRFSGRALTQGLVNARIDGVPVRIYSTAKTVADCFKYRRTVSPEIAIHALRESLRQNKRSHEKLWHFARICRVERLVRTLDSYEPTDK